MDPDLRPLAILLFAASFAGIVAAVGVLGCAPAHPEYPECGGSYVYAVPTAEGWRPCTDP